VEGICYRTNLCMEFREEIIAYVPSLQFQYSVQVGKMFYIRIMKSVIYYNLRGFSVGINGGSDLLSVQLR
jgi:hypothetical protein